MNSLPLNSDLPSKEPDRSYLGQTCVSLGAHLPRFQALARSRGVSVASLVRTASTVWLNAQPDGNFSADALTDGGAEFARYRVNAASVAIRVHLSAQQAVQLDCKARSAQVSRDFYVARLIDDVPVLAVPPDQQENRAVLMRSTATLAALSRDLRALIRMLHQPSTPALLACKAPAEQIAQTVDQHLVIAARMLAALVLPQGPRNRS